MTRFILILAVGVLVLPLLGCGDGGGTPGRHKDEDRPKTSDLRK